MPRLEEKNIANLPERVMELPDLFESHSLMELCDWLNAEYPGQDVTEHLTEDLMRASGFVDCALENETRPVWSMLRRLRSLIGCDGYGGELPGDFPTAGSLLRKAPKPVAWNELEILSYGYGHYHVDSWGEIEITVTFVFGEMLNPGKYNDKDEYLRLMSSDEARRCL